MADKYYSGSKLVNHRIFLKVSPSCVAWLGRLFFFNTCPQPLVQIKQLKAERGIQALYSTLLPRPEEEWGEDPPLPTGCGDGKTQHKGTGTVQEPRSLDQSPGTKTDEAAPEEEVQRKG